jgi:hypothetical protein
MTLHTGPGCSIDGSGDFSGVVKSSNCYVDATGQDNNEGCGIQANAADTYGDGFNSAGGGVYAIDWTSQAISIYYFGRSSIPSDITAGTPNPDGWPEPLAQFEGACNIGSIFQNHSIIFDTTFCGQWAGQQSVWASDPVCSQKAATCQDYVANNPADFAQTFWQVNSLKVYQSMDGFIGTSAASSQPSSSSAASTGTPAAATTFATTTSVVIPTSSQTINVAITQSDIINVALVSCFKISSVNNADIQLQATEQPMSEPTSQPTEQEDNKRRFKHFSLHYTRPIIII